MSIKADVVRPICPLRPKCLFWTLRPLPIFKADLSFKAEVSCTLLFDDHGGIIFRKFPLLFVGIFLLKVLHHVHVGTSMYVGT